MSVQIITGYTGERHITPYMDAAVNRGIFGSEDCILSTGGQLAASMPTINSFVMQDGLMSIQGHLAQSSGETLAVDTCATGSNRIDLVVARFTHNTITLIDNVEIILVKGEETTSAYPTTPAINEGTIADGTAVADMVLYKITLSGPEVSFERAARIHASDIYAYNGLNSMIEMRNEMSNYDTGFSARRKDTGASVFFGIGSGGTNHGIWSRVSNHWMLYEDANGVARIGASDLRVGGHSSSIGDVRYAYLSSNKTCANNKWVSVCSISLDAGVWVCLCGLRWADMRLVTGTGTTNTGDRAGNLNQESGNASANIRIASAPWGDTSARFTVIVKPTSTTRYYLNAFQRNISGTNGEGISGTMLASGQNYGNFITAVRIL